MSEIKKKNNGQGCPHLSVGDQMVSVIRDGKTFTGIRVTFCMYEGCRDVQQLCAGSSGFPHILEYLVFLDWPWRTRKSWTNPGISFSILVFLAILKHFEKCFWFISWPTVQFPIMELSTLTWYKGFVPKIFGFIWKEDSHFEVVETNVNVLRGFQRRRRIGLFPLETCWKFSFDPWKKKGEILVISGTYSFRFYQIIHPPAIRNQRRVRDACLVQSVPQWRTRSIVFLLTCRMFIRWKGLRFFKCQEFMRRAVTSQVTSTQAKKQK